MVRIRLWPLLLAVGVLFSIFSVSAVPAFAAVMQANDAVFGENALIRDLDNKRDWLRLDFTTAFTFNEVSAQLGPGGTFEGWSIAAVADLNLLGVSAGIVHQSENPEVIARAEQLRDFFCPAETCVETSTTHILVRGLVSDPGAVSGTQAAFTIGRCLGATGNCQSPNDDLGKDAVDFRVSGFGGRDVAAEEIFLVRDTPTTFTDTEPNEAVSTEVLSQAGACGTVRRILGARGRTQEIIPVKGSLCVTTQEQLQITVNGVPLSTSALFVSPDAKVTFEGTHKFCWASTTTGQMTCIQTPAH